MKYKVRTFAAFLGTFLTPLIASFAAPFIISRLLEQIQAGTVTLEGSMHRRTYPKIFDLLVGGIDRATVNQERCTGGIVAAINGTERYNGTVPASTVPWHKTYANFAGRLPDVIALYFEVERARFGIRDASGLCTGLYFGAEDALELEYTREAGGAITGVNALETRSLRLVRRDAGFLCPETATIRGRGTLTVAGSSTRVTITLI